MDKFLKIFLIPFFTLSCACLSYADSINLTTYNPSPLGSYTQLRLYPQSAPGCTMPGLMYMDGATKQLKICNGTAWNPVGPWTQNSAAKTVHVTNAVADAAYKVGIGVIPAANSMKLHIAQDGGILAEGTFGSGASIGTTTPGARFLWYPKKAAIRALLMDTNQTQINDDNVGNFSAAFGWDNFAGGSGGFVVGSHNSISQTSASSSIAGGYGNKIINAYLGSDFIGGGHSAVIESWQSAIIGGYYNYIYDDGSTPITGRSFIGGGLLNKIRGRNSVIFGGNRNETKDEISAIAGGSNNVTNAGYNFIGGGASNITDQNASSVIGGTTNHANSPFSFVGGGATNQINLTTGWCPSITGGLTNKAENRAAHIMGGEANEAYSDCVIAGGAGNKAGAVGISGYAFIGGGFVNQAATITDGSGGFSTVSGGAWNIANGRFSVILGGGRDGTGCAGNNPVGCPGYAGNIASGYSSFIGGGFNNVASGSNSTVPGGGHNQANGIYSAAMGQSAVVDGGFSFAWEGNAATAVPVAVNNSFVVFPSGLGNLIVGTNANASAVAPAGTYSDVKLFVNGPIGGALERGRTEYGELQMDCHTNPGQCKAVYAP